MLAVNISRIPGASMAVAAIALLTTATFAYADDHVLRIGQAGSPTLKALIGGRQTTDARDFTAGRKKDPEAARQAKAALKAADFVAVDLSEVDPSEEDLKLIDDALEAGLPIVIENANAPRMAALFGVGIANSLAIVEYDSKSHKGKVNLADPMPMEDIPGYEQLPQANANFGDRVRFAQEILTKRPFTRGAQNQAIGFCGSVPLSACREFTFAAPGINFCPYRWVNRTYTCENGLATIDPQMEVGLYAARDGNGTSRKYFFVRAIGGWHVAASVYGGDPPSRDWAYERFPFFSRYRMSMTPYTNGAAGLPAGWKLLATAPTNSNGSTSVSSTTGWSITGRAGCGAESTGPTCSAGVTAGYSSSRTYSMELQDWSTMNNSGSVGADFTYFMSKADLNGKPVALTYNQLMDLSHFNKALYKGVIPSWEWTGLATLPSWSMKGRHANGTSLAEAVWMGENSTPFLINLQVTAEVRNMAVTSSPTWYGQMFFAHTSRDVRSGSDSVMVNPSRVN
jgi:hypothetical protein